MPASPAADYIGYLEEHHRKQTAKLEGMRKEVKALEIMKEWVLPHLHALRTCSSHAAPPRPCPVHFRNYEQIVRAQGQQVLGGSGPMATSQLPGDINFKLVSMLQTACT